LGIVHIERRTVARLAREAPETVHYDQKLTGFGMRVARNGSVSYFVEYRPGAGGRRVQKRRLVIGKESPAFRADMARDKAEKLLGAVAQGEDPAIERKALREAATVAEIVEHYLTQKIDPTRKASTGMIFRGHFTNYIRPEIGGRLVVTLAKGDVTRLHRKIGVDRQVTANRVLALLHAAIEYGRSEGLLPEDLVNPAKGVDRFRETGRERYLSADELRRLGATLRLAESEGLPWQIDESKNIKHLARPENRKGLVDPGAVAAIRLLLLTGCRLREILHLRWDDIDLERGTAMLQDSKVGRRALILGGTAVELLARIPRKSVYVIPGASRIGLDGHPVDAPRADLKRPWARVQAHADLRGVRLHDLRHTFAAIGAGAGFGLQLVGGLLGHASPSTTQRYAHLADDPLRRASDSVAATLSAAMEAGVG
jgi:integrase